MNWSERRRREFRRGREPSTPTPFADGPLAGEETELGKKVHLVEEQVLGLQRVAVHHASRLRYIDAFVWDGDCFQGLTLGWEILIFAEIWSARDDLRPAGRRKRKASARRARPSGMRSSLSKTSRLVESQSTAVIRQQRRETRPVAKPSLRASC